MKPSIIFTGCCIMVASMFSTAHAQDSQFYKTQPTGRANQAMVVVRAAEHPEVAVDRELSSQPVHPWMAEVQVGNLTTYVDPAQDLSCSGLDDNHTLRRAQERYNSMTGVTTNDLAALKNAALAAVNQIPQGNRAHVVVMPMVPPQDHEVQNIHIIFPSGKPNQNMPSVPKQAPASIEQVATK